MKRLNVLALALLTVTVLFPQPVAALRIPFGMRAFVGSPAAMRGQRLQNLQGDYLGRIEDVTVDSDGMPALMIVSVMGNKLVAIPYSALVPSSARDRFVVNISRGQIERMPGWSPNALSNLGSLR